ncbi:Cof-type HAD-IIB family hydrolase [[Phormidium] sp. ETS-05]|uniref:Cof-type HAD-IIB family hydrolase n=1 Tax=[Phormidium] sp. ETS-05 TaxID=222819 RepID=UPI0018EF2963|nr:Cof-type HAD-IIB family hydrolase [[Phormidium] sp. ETS-05]
MEKTALVPEAEIKLLVLDIDGTIAGESNQISGEVKEAIAAVRKRGVPVAIATGRMYQSAFRFYQDVGSNLPLIAYQGAYIKDPTDEKIHWHQPVAADIARELLECFQELEITREISLNYYSNDQLYVRELTPGVRAYGNRTGVTPMTISDMHAFAAKSAPTKILALSEDASAIDRLFLELRQRFTPDQLYITKSHTHFVEALHPMVNKGVAVRYLAEEVLGITAAEVMAIGDNYNDLEMLEYAGLSVAMGNAPEAVQAKAHWVAPSVEAHGAAAAIAEFLLSKST